MNVHPMSNNLKNIPRMSTGSNSVSIRAGGILVCGHLRLGAEETLTILQPHDRSNSAIINHNLNYCDSLFFSRSLAFRRRTPWRSTTLHRSYSYIQWHNRALASSCSHLQLILSSPSMVVILVWSRNGSSRMSRYAVMTRSIVKKWLETADMKKCTL